MVKPPKNQNKAVKESNIIQQVYLLIFE